MRKIIIAPSILAADMANLGRDVKMSEEAGAKYLHIDIMDGHFVPNLSYCADTVRALRPISNQVFDVHLLLILLNLLGILFSFLSLHLDPLFLHYYLLRYLDIIHKFF